jgi:hypothetical protein
MQVDAAVQLPPAPLKPTCVLLFKTGPCADSWRNYHQAVQQWNQLYVQHQQQIAASQATAPLQQQITDEHQQITTLQEQIIAAHTQGLQQGAGIGVGAALILFGVIYAIKRLMGNFTVTKKPQTRAASA